MNRMVERSSGSRRQITVNVQRRRQLLNSTFYWRRKPSRNIGHRNYPWFHGLFLLDTRKFFLCTLTLINELNRGIFYRHCQSYAVTFLFSWFVLHEDEYLILSLTFSAI